MTDTITVVGNIATNPEQRTAGPSPVTSFRVATSERRLDAQGAWVDAHTNYYSVSAFRSLGDHAFTSLRRGDRVIVSGRLRLKEWTAADGTKGRSIEIDADALGHDLRFGTSVFQRANRSEGASGTESPATDAAWSPPTSEGWGAPGVEGGADATTAVSGEAGELSSGTSGGAPAGEERALAFAGADTPF